MLVCLEPSKKHLLRFRLKTEVKHRIIVEVSASEEVEVALFHGAWAIHADDEERERVRLGLAYRSPMLRGTEYAYAKGRRFALHTTGECPGGYWVVAIENLSGFTTELSVRAWAEHPATADETSRAGLAGANPSPTESGEQPRSSVPSESRSSVSSVSSEVLS